MSTPDVLVASRTKTGRKKLRPFGHPRYRLRMSALMLCADLAGFGLAALLVFSLNAFLGLFILSAEDIKYSIAILLCLMLFVSSKLYPGVGINPAEEIKLITQFISMGFLIGLIVLGCSGNTLRLNYLALLPGWGFSLISVLAMRWLVRIVSAQLGWWGEPVVIVARDVHLSGLPCYFCGKRRLGFIPVVITNGVNRKCADCTIPSMNLEQVLASDPRRFSDEGIQTVVIDTSSAFDLIIPETSKKLLQLFRHMIFVSDLEWLEGASIRINDYEGLMGVEAQKNTLSGLETGIKRGVDLLLTLVIGALTLPLMLLAAILIKFDSQGPVFYVQERLGLKGKTINLYKFRTMVTEADRMLVEYLDHHPEALEEWQSGQKLQHDPRVTRIGRFLRRYSIDELPQLFNVLKGEMSLVGPRPMLADQIDLYGTRFGVYCGVRPGMTGFWQVSGRNRTTFEERAHYDTYYIRNWSIWLDLYILLRTGWVVLSREGAY